MRDVFGPAVVPADASPELLAERARLADLHRRYVASPQPVYCWYCSGKLYGRSWVEEHVTPRSRGGTDNPGNLVDACQSCNTVKGARTLEEYRALLEARSGRRPWVFFGELPGNEHLTPDLAPDPVRDYNPADPWAHASSGKLGL